MSYFNYHNTARKLIQNGKLISCYFTKNHNKISPALVLIFDDEKHKIMPIRKHRWEQYFRLIFEYF